MRALSRFLHAFYTSAASAWIAFDLGRGGDGVGGQRRCFRSLLKGFSLSAFGKSLRLRPGLSYEEFRRRVPLQNQASLAASFQAMEAGAEGVLWPGRCERFVSLPSLPGEAARRLPVTPELGRHFDKAWRRSLLHLTAQDAPLTLLKASQCWLGATPGLRRLESGAAPEVGDLPDVLAACLADRSMLLFRPFQSATVPPFPDAANKPELTAMTMVVNDPEWLPGFIASLSTTASEPDPEIIITLCPPLGIHAEDMRRELGTKARLHEVFATETGIFGAQDGAPGQGMRLFTSAGLFFEFLPLRHYDEKRFPDLGDKVLPLSAVRTGVDYVVVLSSPAGLCRYDTGEVLRFVSTKPCRVQRIGQAQNLLHGQGEYVTERLLSDCLANVCAAHGWRVVHFHVAPLVESDLTGQKRENHEWWVELRPGTAETPTGAMLENSLDQALRQASPDYSTKRKNKVLGTPVVRLVMPGVFEQWLGQNGFRDGHFSMPRCLPNRRIADELARLARFYR